MILEIDVSDVDEEIQKKVDDFIFEVANEFLNQLKIEIPVYEGRGRQSLQILGRGDGVVYVGTNLGYLYRLHEGLAPIEPIKFQEMKRWVRIQMSPDDEAIYPIAKSLKKKIEREGPEPNPFVDRAIENLKQRYG